MEPSEVNKDPARIHGAEQQWARAREHLDLILNHVKNMEPHMTEIVGGNTDVSVTFDFMLNYIRQAERFGGITAHQMTVAMCAAAITRLVSAPLTEDQLAQLDWTTPTIGDGQNDDH